MKTQRFTKLKKLIASITLAMALFTPALPALAVDAPPEITNSYANPTSFDPSANQKDYFYWYLAAPNANIEVDVYDGKKSQNGTKIRDLIGLTPWSSVPNPIAYDGKINGVALKAGTYHYYITASNGSGTDEWEQAFTVTGTGTAGNGGGDNNNGGSAPVLGTSVGLDSNDYASPNPFDPNTQTSAINYTLSQDATVYITIKDPNTNATVETMFATQTAGTRSQVWDGKNASNQPYTEKVYNYEIYATNQYGNNTETGTVEVKYASQNNGGSAPVVGTSSGDDSNDYASPNPFDPNTQTSTINYTLSQDATVYVTIKDPNTNQAVETLFAVQSAGARSVVWDGKNTSNQPFAEKVYNYEIYAANQYGNNTETGTVQIKYALAAVAPVIGTSGGNDSMDYASPNPFDPNIQTTTIYYTLNTSVDSVTVNIKDGGVTIESINGGTTSENNTFATAVWDGKDTSDTIFANKVYDYEIIATNSAGSNTETGTVEVKTTTTTNAPDITEVYASPYSFIPADAEQTALYFRITKDANVSVDILDGGTVQASVLSNANAYNGLNYVYWNGKNSSNNILSPKVYTVRVTACDKYQTTFCDTEYGNVQVENTNGNGTTMNITDDFADPSPFNPDDENTRVYYTLNQQARVTVDIRNSGSSIIQTLLTDNIQNSGANQLTWNGKDKNGNMVDSDNYTYKIYACDYYDSTDCDTETGSIEVDFDLNRNNDLVTDVQVNNEVFNPDKNEKVQICFDIIEDNTYITLDLLDGNKVIKTFINNQKYNKFNNLCFNWNGDDKNNNSMDDGVYQFRIRAEKGSDTEVKTAYTELDTDGHLIGFPGSDNSCAGFTDVPVDSPLCKVVQMMNFKGIFMGYSDQSFRPYADINRAEATKVIMLALGHSILADDGTNLGYGDVQNNAWYMPYLRTAQRLNIATGYPDRTFRPGGTMNRVELLKIFLESSDITVPACNIQPYADTPVNYDTNWYIKYACFAKAYGLMRTDAAGNFNPAQPMTRADVADLFYQFEMRGLFAGYNPVYYDNYYGNFNSTYYMTPGYNYGY